MSKLVTLEQAIGLAKVGYCQDSIHQYKYNDVGKVIELGSSERMYNIGNEWNAPAVSEALEWFREVKGIHCSVMLGSYFDGSVRYVGQYLIDVYTDYVEKQTQLYYDTYSEAESALLDALIEYAK